MNKKTKKVLLTAGGVVVLGVAYLLGGPLLFSSCGSTGDYAMKRLRDCPEAKELLGDGIDTSFGISYGSVETQGGLERANVRIPVSGSKGSGTYSYVADRVGNEIRFAGGLEAGGKTVDIGTCGGAPSSAEEAANTGTGSFEGKVASSNHPEVEVGSTCKGSITLRGTRTPSEIVIKCGDVTLYDGKGTARNNVNDPNNPDDDILSFTDDKTSDADETPSVSLLAQERESDAGNVIVKDVAHDGAPAFEIKIDL